MEKKYFQCNIGFLSQTFDMNEFLHNLIVKELIIKKYDGLRLLQLLTSTEIISWIQMK